MQAIYNIMQKFLKSFFTVFLCLISLLPMKSLAVDDEKIQWFGVDFTDERTQEILDLNPEKNASTRADDLILTYNVAIAKNSTNSTYIDMVAKMVCDMDVVKCGFKKIVLQKRPSTSSSWSNALTLEDLYCDDSSHAVGRTFSVPSGYQYRVVCTFYAKKSLLVTQKIELTSNYVSFW